MTGRIWLDGEERDVRGATFTIHLRTLPSHLDEPAWADSPDPGRVRYALEIDVDEDSGEDGALAPDAPYIPVMTMNRLHCRQKPAPWRAQVPENGSPYWAGDDVSGPRPRLPLVCRSCLGC